MRINIFPDNFGRLNLAIMMVIAFSLNNFMNVQNGCLN